MQLTTASQGFDLTVLCDNDAAQGLRSVHGLCMLLKAPDVCVLLDCGPDATAVSNADALGVDLSQVDAIVLSHGHVDHTGGLEHVLERTGAVRIVAHPAVFERTYSCRAGAEPHDIGMPMPRESYERMGATFELTQASVSLGSVFATTGEVPRPDPRQAITSHLLRQTGESLEPDAMPDDMSVIARLDDGAVIVTGCAHAGLMNIVAHAQALTGLRRIHGIFGGTHLVAFDNEGVRAMARDLAAAGVRALGPCHCTGPQATRVLHDCFDGLVLPLKAGDALHFKGTGEFDVTS